MRKKVDTNRSVRIEVTDGKALAEVLEQTGLPYKILTPNVAEVYSRVNISRLTSALEKYQCEVLSIQEREENLESYYVNLIGGNAIFLIKVQKKLPHFNNALRVKSVDRLVKHQKSRISYKRNRNS